MSSKISLFRTIPNQITLSRIAFVPLLMFLILFRGLRKRLMRQGFMLILSKAQKCSLMMR